MTRYNNVAISLHWLMAIAIIGMLATGKFMVSLDEADPLRFTLTQWHKTFGVLLLLLAVVRLLWRLTHKAPAHPVNAPTWEKRAASASHILLYTMLFLAPITGWMLVSVSPLKIDTLLFNVVPWPHIAWLEAMAEQRPLGHLFHSIHHNVTAALIALIVIHFAAAMKHHFIDKDSVLSQMSPTRASKTFRTMLLMSIGIAAAVGATVYAYASLSPKVAAMVAGPSQVSANARVMGEATLVNFADTSVEADISLDSPENSSLHAVVATASANTMNLQVLGALQDEEWFDSANHPEATFTASKFEKVSDTSLEVTGTMTIKQISKDQTFTLHVRERQSDGQRFASGEFNLDRTAYQLGMESQPTDDYVANDVIIAFEFELN